MIVLFPTLGKPTKPTSARSFNSTFISRSSPGSPFSEKLGAVFACVLKAVLPRPPLPPCATTKEESFPFKSAKTRPVSISVITVP